MAPGCPCRSELGGDRFEICPLVRVSRAASVARRLAVPFGARCGVFPAGFSLGAHLLAPGLTLLRVGFTFGPKLVTPLPVLGAPLLARLRILLTPGPPFRGSGLALLALLRILLAPRLHSRPAFLESRLYLLATVGLFGATLLDTLLVAVIGRESQDGERHRRGAD